MVTLAATALVSLEEAKDFLTVTKADQDDMLRRAINQATEYCELATNRPLKRAAYTNLRLAGPCRSPRLWFKAAPIDITQALTVTVNGVIQTVWKSEADGDPDLFDVLVADSDALTIRGQRDHLYRALGWAASSAGNPMNVLLGSLTGGFPTIPDDLKEAALLVVQKFFRDQQRGTADLATVTTPAGSLTIYDRSIPARARETLLSYRVVPA